MDREHSQVNNLLAEATNLIRREKEATGNVEPAEGYKRRQIEELKLFATQHNLWININSLPLSYLSKGGENEVFTGHEDVDHHGLLGLIHAADERIRDASIHPRVSGFRVRQLFAFAGKAHPRIGRRQHAARPTGMGAT